LPPKAKEKEPILSHIGELRQRLISSLLAVTFLFFLVFFFSDKVINFLKEPLVNSLPGKVTKLHFTGPLDVFLASIKVSFLTAVVLACPIWIYHFWKFIEPALYKKEKTLIRPFILISISLFMLGLSFCYWVILPITLSFLINLGLEVGTPMITINDYFSIITMMIFSFGIIFEFPLLLILLAYLNIIHYHSLKSMRRYICIGSLILAAILTPPDPLSQIAMAIPLYLMYEIALLIIKFIKKPKAV